MKYKYHRSKAMMDCVSEVLKTSFQNHQKQDQQLFLHWRKIVGNDFATMATPQKFSRGKGTSCLILGTKTGTSSVMLHHLSPQLIETINGYFGYKYVDRLQFEPAKTVNLPKPFKRPSLPLPKVEFTKIKDALDRVTDQDLKDALHRLGQTLDKRSTQS